MVPEIKSYALEELTVGLRESLSRTVTCEMIEMFAEVSGDFNPIHLDADYAAKSQFGERIAHGALSASFVSAILGTKLPGETAIYMSQQTRFVAPVKIGDTVDVIATVKEIIVEKRRAIIETQCFVNEKLVVDGEAMVYVRKK